MHLDPVESAFQNAAGLRLTALAFNSSLFPACLCVGAGVRVCSGNIKRENYIIDSLTSWLRSCFSFTFSLGFCFWGFALGFFFLYFLWPSAHRTPFWQFERFANKPLGGMALTAWRTRTRRDACQLNFGVIIGSSLSVHWEKVGRGKGFKYINIG